MAERHRRRALGEVASAIALLIEVRTGPGVCRSCGHTTDIIARHRAGLERQDAFAAAHPHIHCPECRKRVSARCDNFDAYMAQRRVGMQCPHCRAEWSIDR